MGVDSCAYRPSEYYIQASGSYKHFTFLQEILHLVDRHDLITLYSMVSTYFQYHTLEGAGLFLLGDLHVLFDSVYHTGKGFKVWENY